MVCTSTWSEAHRLVRERNLHFFASGLETPGMVVARGAAAAAAAAAGGGLGGDAALAGMASSASTAAAASASAPHRFVNIELLP